MQCGCWESCGKNLVVKPGLELDLCHRSSYTEKCLDFGNRKVSGRSGLPDLQVSLRTLLPTAAEMGWLYYPDECLHFNFNLFSFISNLVLHVLGLLMPHCSTNHAAIALVKQCVGVGFFLGTGTHGEPSAHPSLVVHSYCFEAKRKSDSFPYHRVHTQGLHRPG